MKRLSLTCKTCGKKDYDKFANQVYRDHELSPSGLGVVDYECRECCEKAYKKMMREED